MSDGAGNMSRRAIGSFFLLSLVAAGCSSGAAEDAVDLESSESNLSEFVCSSSETVKNAPNAPYGQLVSTRAAAHPGFDRFVMEFKPGSGVPNYRVYRQGSPKFFMDGSGDPIELTGAAGIGITAQMASGWDMQTGQPIFNGPRRFSAEGTGLLNEAAFTGDFEGQVNWALGLKRTACHRVFELSNPPRLVVDIQTNGQAPADPVPPPSNPFTCEADEIINNNATDSGGEVKSVRVSSNPEYDRFVMEFAGNGVPNFDIRRKDNAIFSGPGEQSYALSGAAGLDVSVHTASNPSAGSRRFKPTGTTLIREVAQYEDFEGYVGWGLGLTRSGCYRAFRLSNPARLVVDVQK
jgi:hypothetical protein